MKNMENMNQIDQQYHLIDFHTHILPGMDDGAGDVATSTEMLNRLKQQGVTTVVLTPHFYTDRETLSDFLERRTASFELIQPIAEQLGIEVVPAGEMYFTDYIFNYENILPLCIGSGRYVLTELPFSCHFTNSMFDKISRFMGTLNVIPVLAHIERYPQLIKDEECLNRLENMGCLAQVNLGSLTDGLLQRKAILRLIREGLVHAVGTDCHNLAARPPRYRDGIQVIQKKLGDEFVETLMNNSLQVIRGQ